MTRTTIADDLRASRDDFRQLVDQATTAELRVRSNGTKWTDGQLLFHMLLGHLIVRTLLWLVPRLRSPAACLLPHVRRSTQQGQPAIPRHQLSRLARRRQTPRPQRHGTPHGPRHRQPAPHPRTHHRRPTRPRDALPRRLGPLLPSVHDRRRRTWLHHPALSTPPKATHTLHRRASCDRSRTTPHSPPSRRPDRGGFARRRPTSRALRVATRWPPATLDPGHRRARGLAIGSVALPAHRRCARPRLSPCPPARIAPTANPTGARNLPAETPNPAPQPGSRCCRPRGKCRR